jgi:cell wall-associated NlpC family hydrolase
MTILGGLLVGSAPLIHAQSNAAVGGFVSYVPSASSTTSYGVTATTGTAPLSLRASGYASTAEQTVSGRPYSPWGVDADAVLQLSLSGRATTAPYIFAGIGIAGRDDMGTTATSPNWSYGGGLNVALGRVLDLFGETRYRFDGMALPEGGLGGGRQELRVGVSFRFGATRPTSRPTSGRGTSSSGPSVILAGSARGGGGAAAVLPTADRYLGVTYKWGGNTPSEGFDCSGFTKYVFARHNVKLPRTSREQAQVGTRLSTDWRLLSPGDLVMFAEPGEAISHVAIYVGDDRIIHSSSSGGGVRYDDVTTRRGQWFYQNIVAARRVSVDGSGIVLDLAKNFSDIVKIFDAGDRAQPPK